MDYDYLPTCNYEVNGYPHPGDCGEPAVAHVWWGEGDEGDPMLVCQEHLDFMLKCEAKSTAPPAGA